MSKVKSAVKYLSLVFFSAIWGVSGVPALRKIIAQTGIVADDYRYGDLYRLSNLGQFKEKVVYNSPQNTLTQPKTKHQSLYIIGDSFTEANWINKNDFAIDSFVHIPWYKTQSVSLDTSQYNVLILESVERHFREHFGKPVQNIRLDNYKNAQTGLMADIEKVLGAIEETLESLWLSGDWCLVFKEAKAKLNYTFFDRTNDKVSVSKNKKNLLFRLDTDSTLVNSCFNKILDSEIDSLVQTVNQTSEYYKANGFDAVYLSVIPNKTSIVAANDGPYNHLVERIQKHPKLTVPAINVWADFNKIPDKTYLRGDSHWNNTGRDIWLQKANELIFR